MICPKCGAEDVEGFTRCSDCHVDLVEPDPEPSEVPEATSKHAPPKIDYRSLPQLSLVTVLATGDPGLMAIAKSLLQAAEIPYQVPAELAA